MQKPIVLILSKLSNVKGSSSSGKWTARCPAHNDKRNSLSISEGHDGKVLLNCFAGCHNEDIVRSIGLSMSDLFEKKEQVTSKKRSWNITETYDYTDENHQLLYQVCRTDEKQFPQRTPDGNDGWNWGLNSQKTVPYQLPRLLEGIKGGYPIFLVEGEKDVERLISAELYATTAPMGANKWKSHYNEYFRNVDLIILPDNDAPGLQHAQHIAVQLESIAKRIRILQLPGLQEKQDVSDWLDLGNTPSQLLGLSEETKIFTSEKVDSKTQYPGYALLEEEEAPQTGPALPRFPLEVFPKSVQEIVHAYADSVSASPDIAAVQALSIVSLALGPDWRIRAVSFERASRLWLATVAPPGSGKTPVMIAMMKPVEKREQYFRALWERQVKDWKAHRSKDETEEKPIQSHAKTDDFNIDALINALSASPKGIILDIDELIQLFGLIEQTQTGGKGRSRGAFLSMWSGKPVSVIRKKSDDLYVNNPYVIVSGGTQPDTLGTLGLSQGDGMAQRFLWSHPSSPEKSVGYGPNIPSCIKKVWEDTIYNAFDSMNGVTEATPEAIAFGDQAIRDFNQRKNEMNRIGLSAFAAMYAKAPDHLHRLIACLHGMDCLFDGKSQEEVGLKTFKRAFKLTEYFLAHSKYCITLAMSGRSQEASFQELRSKDQTLFSALQKLVEMEGEQTLSTSDWAKALNKHNHLKTNAVRLGKSFKRLSELPLPGLSIERPEGKDRKARLWKIILKN